MFILDVKISMFRRAYFDNRLLSRINKRIGKVK